MPVGSIGFLFNWPAVLPTPDGTMGIKVKIFEGAETMGDILTRRTAAE
jgi:hypothetical protein